MSRVLTVRRAGPGLTVQDFGRPGYLTYGLSRGGAADVQALYEGAALLGQPAGLAVLEMGALGGVFEASEDMRIALTGAPMPATIDVARVAWNASHLLPAGAVLSIGAAPSGGYGYLSVGGGIETPEILGARSAHLAAGIGGLVTEGAKLPIGTDSGSETGLTLPASDRFGGGALRVVPSLQTALFDDDQIARFEATRFTRDTRSNRMGARMNSEGDGFAPEKGLSILSEVIVSGDVQITGDGTPFVLLCECGTMGGYPRIGAVLPCDIPRVAQAGPKDALTFRFVTREAAEEIEAKAAKARADLAKQVTPLVRDPHQMRDLLSYEFVSGVVAGDEADD